MDYYEIGGKWLDDLHEELSGSDRACAVLGGAIVDDRLKALLLKYLLPPKKGEKEDRLLGRGAVVESFSSRIELARRLNLISEDTRRSFEWIREIRNRAAHFLDFRFTDDATRDRVSNILQLLRVRDRAPSLLKPPYDTPKGNFVTAVFVLMAGLEIELGGTSQTQHRPVDAVSTMTFKSKD